MKAESIEQIREHLARGGRVTAVCVNGHREDVEEVCREDIYTHDIKCGFNNHLIDHWELVPIEEEKKVVCLPIETAQSCLACLSFMIDDFMTRQYAGLDYKTLANARDQLRRAVEEGP